ncbi:hypothetical protein ABVT39_020699 [Epinephelus coioides]
MNEMQKETRSLSLSPWSSVLHSVEDGHSCRLLQPNKSALKRDILARRRNGRLAVAATSLSPPLPGNGGELPVPAQRHLEPDTQVETTGENPPSQSVGISYLKKLFKKKRRMKIRIQELRERTVTRLCSQTQ